MKAVLQHSFGPPEVLRLEEVPDPIAGPGEVVVAVQAAGVNPVEAYIRSGIYPKPATPFTLGTDGAGLIDSVGEGVDNVAVGDRVYIAGSKSGTYAEKSLCNARNVHPLPANVSFTEGAGVHLPYITAYQALFHRGQVQSGEQLFVHGGSGAVGIAAIQFARQAGVSVIASAGSDEGRKLVLEQGAVHALDHTAPNYLDQISEITEGKGVDLILEMLANVNLAKDLEIITRYGRIVLIGNRGVKNQGTVTINPRAAMVKDVSILGMTQNNASREERHRIHAEIGAGLSSGTICPIVGQEFTLEEAPLAHRALEENKALGKLVLTPQQRQ